MIRVNKLKKSKNSKVLKLLHWHKNNLMHFRSILKTQGIRNMNL
jgi:hypothetical protein